MQNNQSVQEWKFQQITLFHLTYVVGGVGILAYVAWKIWYMGQIGLLLLLLMIYLILAAVAAFSAWRYWQHTRNGQEFLRLQSNGFAYNIYPHGSGSLKYEWLRVIQIVRDGKGVVRHLHFEYEHPDTGFEYEMPTHEVILETLDLDFSRINMKVGILENTQIMVAEHIYGRCVSIGHQIEYLFD